jgi:predicted dehydrogenase
MGWAQRLSRSHNVQVAAVCDLWEKRRESAAKRISDAGAPAPAVCRNIHELLDRKDVDAVLIATADFQHCYHAAQAVLAGKDVYVEKPFGCDYLQVRRAYEVISRSDRILAVGTQARGADKYYAAAKFVQSGKLGQVQYVEISEPISQQRWRIPGSEHSPAASEVDWNEFLTYLPPEEHPFEPRHYREFRLFWPFSSGPFCQWMSHRIDLVNLVLGKLPTAAVALGGVFLWRDGRNNPDTVQSLLEYPGGVLVSSPSMARTARSTLKPARPTGTAAAGWSFRSKALAAGRTFKSIAAGCFALARREANGSTPTIRSTTSLTSSIAFDVARSPAAIWSPPSAIPSPAFSPTRRIARACG